MHCTGLCAGWSFGGACPSLHQSPPPSRRTNKFMTISRKNSSKAAVSSSNHENIHPHHLHLRLDPHPAPRRARTCACEEHHGDPTGSGTWTVTTGVRPPQGGSPPPGLRLVSRTVGDAAKEALCRSTRFGSPGGGSPPSRQGGLLGRRPAGTETGPHRKLLAVAEQLRSA